MKDYVIFTDSTCDLTEDLAKELGILVLPLTFTIDGKDYLNYLDGRELSSKEFYQKMLAGSNTKTAQLNAKYIVDEFSPVLKEGKDILYICFSSGLSGSYNSARLAKEELEEKYTDNKVYIVDSLCASTGEGLLVWMACEKKKMGASVEENTEYVENLKLKVKHSFTVLDLEYLKRGGRVKPTAAFAAKLLNIKPVLHVDNEGHLIALVKKHGRKAALHATIDNALAGIDTTISFPTFVSGADCDEDREYCKSIIEQKYKELGINSPVYTCPIGPVIGAHAGPGTIAIFTICDKRHD